MNINNEIQSNELEKIILIDHDFDRLLGSAESLWIDCKESPYILNSDFSKYELAKDVSAFANSNGGFILCGIKTKRSLDQLTDIIETIRPFEQNLANLDSYRSIISEWIYPAIEGLRVEWLPTKNNLLKGLICIVVPTQQEHKKWFLIKHVLPDLGKIREIVFGIVVRRMSSNIALTIENLYYSVRDGLMITDKLNRIEYNLDQLRHEARRSRDIQKSSNVEAKIRTIGK